ncbi:type II secretion system F family protein [Nocardioides sp. DS6]|uniref:Type II secretion system F family protein n=1 Tax=Nocardioides eburneus TaxID=3231482 RepID=A0ABV3SWW6_9ACTN
MILLLLLGFICVTGAITLVAMALQPGEGGVTRSLAVLEAMTDAPKELTKDLDRSFADRILEPTRERALRVGRRLAGSDSAERIRRKLDLAGNPTGWTVDRVVSGKVMAAGFGAVMGGCLGVIFGVSLMTGILMTAIGAAAGFFSPDLFLYQRAYDRTERLRKELPDAIDLMAISVEAGLGFDAAVQQVARNTEGPLAEEFSRMLREMQLGTGRAEALRGLGERTSLDDLKSFISAMVQADAFGIPIANVLRVQSSEIRVKRRQWAETKAQQVPVKITIPLIFCILPCLFIMIMGPAALQIMGKF